ncbi:[FeFe] hydrogenase H-cluster radical SAM maturase HydE [Betaproteobacteria bacterium]|nr:[FeFe] hydrogenase H-cluster radical SAM maturase HydE [Betaproteobacteria bacterium]
MLKLGQIRKDAAIPGIEPWQVVRVVPFKRKGRIAPEPMKMLVEKLASERALTRDEYVQVLNHAATLTEKTVFTDPVTSALFAEASAVRHKIYGTSVYTRGLIEFTNYCKNNCYYCGIRRGNKNCERYRLNREQILSCCAQGYELGFRTFVLQGGEDPRYTDAVMVDIVSAVRERFPDCAITLSLGERTRENYEALFRAGANRYLLRHETANKAHYAKLHPSKMSLDYRKQCLNWLKDIGYQIGCGFMVCSPFQTLENLAEDLLFIGELNPHMVGIGPFIPHKDTVFAEAPHEVGKKLVLTLTLLGIIRLMLPNVLLPATTALGTLHPLGREYGIKVGGNVVMPNLSPVDVRKKYLLYDGKICTGDEAAECRHCLQRRMKSIGYDVEISRGDYKCTM